MNEKNTPLRAPTTEPDSLADPRGVNPAISEPEARARFLDTYADSTNWQPLDDDDDAACGRCGGSGELQCGEDTCCCDGGHPCPECGQ